ncbi:hypothetical protein FBD94_03885 [Pedobacter hiemivivus]|uniref:Phage tail collar domain-containing protein n=1 Tax=Pedobacter hiemivivus TaxID=2530454 RepID=A0A4U1GML6_9SPHI|nr:tail fiber protein [Pedobacter hiemivivus]TKC65687.1 hypothetical protein FBD94_03885 [Pedobacter hiemivivus]
MENFIGELKIFTQQNIERIPDGWLICDGTLYDKGGKYRDLASIIGNQFGGDANRFAVPDFRGLLPIGIGPSKDSVPVTRKAGDTGGTMDNVLTEAHLLRHNHKIKVSTVPASTGVAKGAVFGTPTDPTAPKKLYFSKAPQGQYPLNAKVMGTTGGNKPISNVQPVLGVNYFIAAYGIYPSKP